MTGEHVLVVEDNPLNLKLVRDVLQAAGYEVAAATSGEEGLQLAASHTPDLVLMDLQLPGIDGVETMLRLRQRRDTAGVPVIAVTASAMERDQTSAIQAGFDGYMEKPISVRALVREVRELLDGGRR